MKAPAWVSAELTTAIHARQLAEHGGLKGLRDEGALEAAMARAEQRLAYGDANLDLPDLASAYAAGIIRSMPFADGNKRTAYVVCQTFLVLNGWEPVPPTPDGYVLFLGLASGDASEEALADWIKDHSTPLA